MEPSFGLKRSQPQAELEPVTTRSEGQSRAREIVGFAGFGPIFNPENRFISQQEAEKSVHKTLYFSILQYTD